MQAMGVVFDRIWIWRDSIAATSVTATVNSNPVESDNLTGTTALPIATASDLCGQLPEDYFDFDYSALLAVQDFQIDP